MYLNVPTDAQIMEFIIMQYKIMYDEYMEVCKDFRKLII